MSRQRTTTVLVLAASLAAGASAWAQQATVIQPPTQATTTPSVGLAFPPNANCSGSAPCVNVVGEIIRIEESYWVRDPNGQEVHMRVTPESKLGQLPKVGDTIAAQISSTGDAQAIQRVQRAPEPTMLPVPSQSQDDLRRGLSR